MIEENLINRRNLMQLLAATMVGSAIVPGSASAMDYLAEYDKMRASDSIFIPPNGGKNGKVGDSDIQFKFNKSQTDGHFGAMELTVPPGILGAPPHSHKGFDEVCRVLEGTIQVMVGDKVQEVTAGAWHLRPKGLVHTFWNSGNVPAKLVEFCVPGGHEAYMNELSDLFIGNARPQPGALNELAKKYDITFDWAKLPVVMETYKVKL